MITSISPNYCVPLVILLGIWEEWRIHCTGLWHCHVGPMAEKVTLSTCFSSTCFPGVLTKPDHLLTRVPDGPSLKGTQLLSCWHREFTRGRQLSVITLVPKPLFPVGQSQVLPVFSAFWCSDVHRKWRLSESGGLTRSVILQWADNVT